MKILVVEDTEDSRNLLVKQLHAYGYQVMSTANGAEALRQALKEPPDILVTDIMMPEMDGYQLCRQFKQSERLKSIPVVFYTATYTSDEDERFALRLGAAAFIRKPTELDALIRIINEVLEKSRAGVLPDAEVPPLETLPYLTEYNKRLIAKLDRKVAQLKSEIAERKQAEETLRKSETELRSILLSMADLVFVLDKEGKFTSFHVPSEELYLSPGEFAGKRYPDVMPPHVTKLIDDAFAKTKKRGVAEFEYHLEIGGETRWYSAKLSPMLMDDDFTGCVAVVRNVTAQKKAEVEKREMEKKVRLTDRLASIGEMASGIAHEINNPLTSVIGFSELLMEKDLPEDLREDVEIINNGAERVAGIVKGLLTFARQHKLVRSRTSINEIIESTLALRKYALETSNIEVITMLDNKLPWTVADAGQLQQVFLNIIVNAETAMKKAHGRGRLAIMTEQAGDRIRISFADDGPGIAGENLERIFDPFFTTKEVGEGTGLGLSLSRGIITEHNGELYAESEEGRGATFFVELPVVMEEEKVERVEEVEAAGKAVGGRILVVDDEPAILAFLKKLLGGQGYDVATSGSGREALEMIKEQGYGLIISDIRLPGLSGAELYNELGGIAPSLQKMVIFITGDVISADTREFLKATGVPCVPKPFNIAGLKKEIKRVIGENG